MKRFSLIGLALAAVAAGWFYMEKPVAADKPAAKAASQQPTPLFERKTGDIVAAGLVEPLSEEVKVGAELDGTLARVAVEEGQAVRRGQVLAVLVNGDYAARVQMAEAAILERQAELDRLQNGTRTQERREADATVREAEAVLENARIERSRREGLLARGAISRTEFDSADREYRVATARVEAARERAALAHEGYRAEEKRRAEAELARAKGQLAEARALLGKTIITSPLDGVVLRKKLRAGESVSSNATTPIVVLGDLSRLRVRVDVDETDVGRLAVGQPAYVTADAYGTRKFTGRVVKIGQILGRKNVRTDEPTERVDKKILETLVELDGGQSLPVGLRVDAFIQAGKS